MSSSGVRLKTTTQTTVNSDNKMGISIEGNILKMNYRNEKTHDALLIDLVKELASKGCLDILGSALKIDERLGNLEHAYHRRPFDVELTFSNLSVVVETKVDTDEDGRLKEERQTERIARESANNGYLKEKKEFRFITYGTSEFYAKPYKTGPASSEFKRDCRESGKNIMYR